ncbi:DUF5678 domain-containing protein [Bacillus thuringiensis]|uniref:DUF5678 domain-containing protein n=4 Tax=Bacillus thuringiensis TaxID=1428 RepID=A0AB33AQ03_BACTU|nr:MULTISPECIES: DUF5678 domain-containing protein [Bacillus]MEC2533172.1 DUF5678 domain-containing protein [Bacillus cereus]MED1153846.1 DUF5678 domain-containing protein [Bacillus paranthracis]AFQ30158.1 hypothetical protein BTF1_30287 [Bacillus thuringiensis HD-789]AJG73909.1 hypothetical protein BF38_5962 [Bacillus thuringiensis]AJH02703.1 hypothetical protein AS86_6395 [Bacillus thuringiensis HD1002]
MTNKQISQEKLEERKKRKWFACQMDDGIIASGNTLQELLEKLGRRNAKYISAGHYEFKDYNSHYAWTTDIYKGLDLVKLHGYDVNDNEWNSWHIDERMDEE